MPTYTVLIPWTNSQGTFKPGDTVELPTDSPADEVEVGRLINYGIVEEAAAPVTSTLVPEPESAPPSA
jgi:hypothetical protein